MLVRVGDGRSVEEAQGTRESHPDLRNQKHMLGQGAGDLCFILTSPPGALRTSTVNGESLKGLELASLGMDDLVKKQ